MIRPFMPTVRLVVALIAALALLSSSAEAQVRRGRAQPVTPRWAPVAVGIRAGWQQDLIGNGSVLGGELRIPVLRSGMVEVVPSADVVWLPNTKDWQYNADVLFVPQGPRGGVFLGAGVGWRNSPYGGAPNARDLRETYFGYNLLVGGRTTIGPLQLAAALRWTFLRGSEYSPNTLTLGLSYPLWRAIRPSARGFSEGRPPLRSPIG
jgi:hypothetical protein